MPQKDPLVKNSFIFYRSFYEAIITLPLNNQLELFLAISEFSLNKKERNLEGVSLTVFTLIKPQLVANYNKYKNGLKGGRTPKEESKRKPKGKQTETKSEPNENENENVNDNVKEKNIPFIPYAERLKAIIENFKATPLKKYNPDKWANTLRLLIENASKERVERVLAFYKVNIGKQYIPECFGADSFREKFEKLERAVARGNQTQPGFGFKGSGKGGKFDG